MRRQSKKVVRGDGTLKSAHARGGANKAEVGVAVVARKAVMRTGGVTKQWQATAASKARAPAE